jgi:hypothetical protein
MVRPTISSLDELLEKCGTAMKENWITEQELTLATIRRRLGFPISKDGIKDKQIEELKPVYVEFCKELQDYGKHSDYLKPIFESDPAKPEGPVVILQFLYFIDVATDDKTIIRMADVVAKDTTVGNWCRKVLQDPGEYHDTVIECCLSHLQKFSFIINKEEKDEYVDKVIFQNSNEVGLRLLRSNLTALGETEGASAMTLAHALYFHTAVEAFKFGDNLEDPLPPAFVQAYGRALKEMKDEFPSNDSYWRTMAQMSAYCVNPKCHKKAPFRCCGKSFYCSQRCRDKLWAKHKKVCEQEKPKKKMGFEFPE